MDRRLVTVSLDNKDAGLMVDVNEEPPSPSQTGCSDETSGRAGIRFHSLPEASVACLKEWIGRRTAVDRPTPAPVAPSPVPTVLGPQSKLAQIAALQREISCQGLEGDAALALIV